MAKASGWGAGDGPGSTCGQRAALPEGPPMARAHLRGARDTALEATPTSSPWGEVPSEQRAPCPDQLKDSGSAGMDTGPCVLRRPGTRRAASITVPSARHPVSGAAVRLTHHSGSSTVGQL